MNGAMKADDSPKQGITHPSSPPKKQRRLRNITSKLRILAWKANLPTLY
ncbi:hypothetical protein K227x_60030 [Rubripirellula lacrimiformis]|uniref:Uncharacterized protein n=1 Tax=Rubripirellula lacrimiformis TaxID=1930273 RepID=A0A517NKA1_9BACT|nr:hypothetical protein K227x_60030 [Rubripirellula lacrimiformis]